MYYLYRQCICLIFLVMVAFLSCSAFRIDQTMIPTQTSDVNKDDSMSSSDFILNLNRLGVSLVRTKRSQPSPTTITDLYLARKLRPHRLRHRHHRIEQAKLRESRLEAMVIPATVAEAETYAQIPSYDDRPQPTAAIVNRSQRSHPRNNHRKHQQPQRFKKQICQELDVARKAYIADTVVLARAESMSTDRVKNYSVSFKIVRRIKKSRFPVDDNLRLTFLNQTKRMNCENDRHGVVRAQIQQSKEYFLFLNSTGNHNYSIVGMPVLRGRRKDNPFAIALDEIKKVTRGDFVPSLERPILKNTTGMNLKKIRLNCTVTGYPIPIISWKKDDVIQTPNNRTRITYSINKKRKMTSTFVIKNVQERDSGRYTCVATQVNGRHKSVHQDIQISNRIRCVAEFQNYCQNGGTCYNSTSINELFCECPEGFSGQHCEQKQYYLNTSSMYSHNSNSIYSLCKLSTLFYCNNNTATRG